MFRWTAKILGLCAFIVAGSVSVWYIQERYSTRRQIEKLEEEKRVLTQVVDRLTDEKRIAQVLVTDQTTDAAGMHTTLLFVEERKDGTTLPPKSFTIDGNVAHIDALVIRFKQNFVKEGDPLRGHSIALFKRLYGSNQSPDQGFAIDAPGKIPEIYSGADPRVSEFEQELWKNFWRLADDKEYRDKFGVEVASGQGVYRPFEPGKIYTLTIQSDGGVFIYPEAIKGIYREALRQRPTTNSN